MRAVFKVLDVEMSINQKDEEVASIVLKSPGSSRNEGAITVQMFAKDVKDNKHMSFQTNIGREVVADVESDLFNEKLQYRLPFNGICISLEAYVRREVEKLKSQNGKPSAVPAKAS